MNRARTQGRLLSVLPVLFVSLIWANVAVAQRIPGYPDDVQTFDPREVALLPAYCKYTMLFRNVIPGAKDQAAIDGWAGRLGPTFIHMHHYCLGLMKENRAVLLSRDPVSRRFYLADAVVEYDYVIDRAPDDFVLLPEIVTKKAQDLVLLGKGPLAEYEFRRAMALKPDYWPPYAYLSDYYKGIGETEKARHALESGLAQTPGVEALQRRLSELSGARSRQAGKK